MLTFNHPKVGEDVLNLFNKLHLLEIIHMGTL